MKEKIENLEKYAIENNVPIIEKDSIEFINKLIKETKIRSILEIGSAIGYSAIMMALSKDDIYITTIERDEERYLECVQNIKDFDLNQKINVVYQDALDINLSNDMKFDMIFIDAAKSQYEKFFEKFKFFLSDNGVIITDNIKFHGYVGKSDELENGNLKSLVKKLENFITFLKENDEFTTKFYDIGDGLAVSVKKHEK